VDKRLTRFEFYKKPLHSMNKQIDASCLRRIRTSEKQRAVQFTDKQGKCFFLLKVKLLNIFITNFRFPAKEL